MKRTIIGMFCAVSMFTTAYADVLFSEDFESVSISGDTAISDFGWVNDIHLYDTRVYNENAVWSWGGTAYTEAFYTTEGMGAGFTSFDLASATGLTFSVQNSSSYNPEVTQGFFALQLDGSTNWYVSTVPVATPTGTWTTREMVFDPSSSLWNTLTVSGTGSVDAGGAVVGSNPPGDLSGTVTGVGFVIVRTSEGTQNFDNFAVFTPEVSTPPGAPAIAKIWMNGTTAKLYWGEVISATNYVVKTAASPGGPYTPVANTTDLSYWVTNLVVGSTNYFVVAAENAAGEGDPSAEVSGVAQSYTIIADSDSSWGDWIYSYKEAVFDGDTGNFYDSAESNGLSYVGLDFGAGNETVPREILYYPRSGYEYRMAGAQFEGSNDGSSWDALVLISSTPALAWTSVYPDTTNAYRYVRLLFPAGGHGNVAEIAFGTNVPPFHEITVYPADGASIPGPTNITVTAEIVEWDAEFDSAELYLNGALVATDNTPSPDGTNLLSYAAGVLSAGSYTGSVVATAVNPSAVVTNTWTFEIVPKPSAVVLNLWNINMAGNETNSVALSSGTVIKAPSTGGNTWNNLISPLDDGVDLDASTWLPTNALDIVDAAGANPIGLLWTGATEDWGVNTSPLDELFQGYFGFGSFNSTMQISGLDPSAKYDIYVYFTWGWNENPVYYNITEGTGEFTSLTLYPEQDNVASGSYADLVRGENYVIFTQLAPSASGNIHIQAYSDDGGWSGLQIAEVPSSGPTVIPNIQAISISGGTVTLQWASETGVTYSILRKTSLTAGSWVEIESGIPGGESTASDQVSMGGTAAEFYRIEGQ